MSDSDEKSLKPQPAVWWRQPMVWLVIGGPIVVVIASFVTLGLAVSHPDPVLETRAPAADDLDAKSASMLPAVQGRNHAVSAVSKSASQPEAASAPASR